MTRYNKRYARNYSEGAAYAVKGGLDLEDTDTPADSIFALGLPGAVADGLLSEADIEQSVSRLMYGDYINDSSTACFV